MQLNRPAFVAILFVCCALSYLAGTFHDAPAAVAAHEAAFVVTESVPAQPVAMPVVRQSAGQSCRRNADGSVTCNSGAGSGRVLRNRNGGGWYLGKNMGR